MEQKDNETEVLENEIGLTDSKIIEEMKRLGFKKLFPDKRWQDYG